MKSLRQKIGAFMLAIVLVVGLPAAASATHNGYRYPAPTLTALSVVSCDEVKVTWKRTSPFTAVNYSRSEPPFLEHLSHFPWEAGPRDDVRGDTSVVVPNLVEGKRYYFRVYASEYGGHRLSKYSNVKSIRVPEC